MSSLWHAGKWVLALTSVPIVHHYTGFTIDRLLGYMPIDKSAADTSPLATPPWLILKTWLPIVTPVGQVWVSYLFSCCGFSLTGRYPYWPLPSLLRHQS